MKFYSETKGHVNFHSGEAAPRGKSGSTQSKGHLKFHFVTKQRVKFESETKGHVNRTFTARQWVHRVGNLRGMLVLNVRILYEVYITSVNPAFTIPGKHAVQGNS